MRDDRTKLQGTQGGSDGRGEIPSGDVLRATQAKIRDILLRRDRDRQTLDRVLNRRSRATTAP